MGAGGLLLALAPFAPWVQLGLINLTLFQLLSITPAIAAEVAALPDSFHRDPADRIIVAASRVLQLPLVTYDRRITRSRLAARWTAR